MDNIIKKKDKEYSKEIEKDVLRAMIILHGSAWKSDLHDTLSTIWRLKKLEFHEMVKASEKLPKILERLRSKKILQWEKRLRADLSRSEPIEDTLYYLENLKEVSDRLSSDHIVLEYRSKIMGYNSLKI
ncbi:MAG: hypothetical protein N3F64_07165 [Nitrososphaeria archaeon]|nr:hypothetical protein [Nitrososphaeria archaeon]